MPASRNGSSKARQGYIPSPPASKSRQTAPNRSGTDSDITFPHYYFDAEELLAQSIEDQIRRTLLHSDFLPPPPPPSARVEENEATAFHSLPHRSNLDLPAASTAMFGAYLPAKRGRNQSAGLQRGQYMRPSSSSAASKPHRERSTTTGDSVLHRKRQLIDDALEPIPNLIGLGSYFAQRPLFPYRSLADSVTRPQPHGPTSLQQVAPTEAPQHTSGGPPAIRTSASFSASKNHSDNSSRRSASAAHGSPSPIAASSRRTTDEAATASAERESHSNEIHRLPSLTASSASAEERIPVSPSSVRSSEVFFDEDPLPVHTSQLFRSSAAKGVGENGNGSTTTTTTTPRLPQTQQELPAYPVHSYRRRPQLSQLHTTSLSTKQPANEKSDAPLSTNSSSPRRTIEKLLRELLFLQLEHEGVHLQDQIPASDDDMSVSRSTRPRPRRRYPPAAARARPPSTSTTRSAVLTRQPIIQRNGRLPRRTATRRSRGGSLDEREVYVRLFQRYRRCEGCAAPMPASWDELPSAVRSSQRRPQRQGLAPFEAVAASLSSSSSVAVPAHRRSKVRGGISSAEEELTAGTTVEEEEEHRRYIAELLRLLYDEVSRTPLKARGNLPSPALRYSDNVAPLLEALRVHLSRGGLPYDDVIAILQAHSAVGATPPALQTREGADGAANITLPYGDPDERSLAQGRHVSVGVQVTPAAEGGSRESQVLPTSSASLRSPHPPPSSRGCQSDSAAERIPPQIREPAAAPLARNFNAPHPSATDFSVDSIALEAMPAMGASPSLSSSSIRNHEVKSLSAEKLGAALATAAQGSSGDGSVPSASSGPTVSVPGSTSNRKSADAGTDQRRKSSASEAAKTQALHSAFCAGRQTMLEEMQLSERCFIAAAEEEQYWRLLHGERENCESVQRLLLMNAELLERQQMLRQRQYLSDLLLVSEEAFKILYSLQNLEAVDYADLMLDAANEMHRLELKMKARAVQEAKIAEIVALEQQERKNILWIELLVLCDLQTSIWDYAEDYSREALILVEEEDRDAIYQDCTDEYAVFFNDVDGAASAISDAVVSDASVERGETNYTGDIDFESLPTGSANPSQLSSTPVLSQQVLLVSADETKAAADKAALDETDAPAIGRSTSLLSTLSLSTLHEDSAPSPSELVHGASEQWSSTDKDAVLTVDSSDEVGEPSGPSPGQPGAKIHAGGKEAAKERLPISDEAEDSVATEVEEDSFSDATSEGVMHQTLHEQRRRRQRPVGHRLKEVTTTAIELDDVGELLEQEAMETNDSIGTPTIAAITSDKVAEKRETMLSGDAAKRLDRGEVDHHSYSRPRSTSADAKEEAPTPPSLQQQPTPSEKMIPSPTAMGYSSTDDGEEEEEEEPRDNASPHHKRQLFSDSAEGSMTESLRSEKDLDGSERSLRQGRSAGPVFGANGDGAGRLLDGAILESLILTPSLLPSPSPPSQRVHDNSATLPPASSMAVGRPRHRTLPFINTDEVGATSNTNSFASHDDDRLPDEESQMEIPAFEPISDTTPPNVVDNRCFLTPLMVLSTDDVFPNSSRDADLPTPDVNFAIPGVERTPPKLSSGGPPLAIDGGVVAVTHDGATALSIPRREECDAVDQLCLDSSASTLGSSCSDALTSETRRQRQEFWEKDAAMMARLKEEESESRIKTPDFVRRTFAQHRANAMSAAGAVSNEDKGAARKHHDHRPLHRGGRYRNGDKGVAESGDDSGDSFLEGESVEEAPPSHGAPRQRNGPHRIADLDGGMAYRSRAVVPRGSGSPASAMSLSSKAMCISIPVHLLDSPEKDAADA